MKDILIEVWIDNEFCRIIGKYYPEDEPPYLVVNSYMYKARKELEGPTPIAIGLANVPKDFLEKYVRECVYMFQENLGVFQIESKAKSERFLAKQTFGYTKIKEYEVTIGEEGEMKLYDLKTILEEFNTTDLENLKVQVNLRHPNDALDYQIPSRDPADISQSITLTKYRDILNIDTYASVVPIPESADTVMTEEEMETNPDKVVAVETNIASVAIEKEVLTLYDKTIEENPDTIPTREELLKSLLDDSNQI